MSKQTTVTTRNDSGKSSSWQQPQVRRLDAGQAEGAVNTGGDNVVFS